MVSPVVNSWTYFVKYLSSAQNWYILAEYSTVDYPNLLLFLDYFAYPLCSISSSLRPCFHEADPFLQLDLYLLIKSNNTIKPAVLCTLCFLAELKTACTMPWLMPPYWRCKLWWHLILRTSWMQGTQWRKLKPPVKGKTGAIQSVNSSFLEGFERVLDTKGNVILEKSQENWGWKGYQEVI